jgi:hypothetical protein
MDCSLETLYFAIIGNFKGAVVQFEVLTQLKHTLRVRIGDENLTEFFGMHKTQ